MMSVSDLFYGGGREPVWIVRTPTSAQKTAGVMSSPQTPQSVTPAFAGTPIFPVTPVFSGDGGLLYRSVGVPAVELKVPVCCEACEERVKHALLNLNGVESVNCNSYTQRVTVTGSAAPADVLRICRKLHKRSELLQKGTPKNMFASPQMVIA